MKSMKMLAASAAAIAAAAGLSGVALAQSTTSEIRGVVTSADGGALSGVVVTIVDTRTGASRVTATDANGNFTARNLVVGGPYSVTTAREGYQSERLEGVVTGLGSSTVLAIDLEAAAAGDEIIVTATRAQVSELAVGPSSSFNLETLEALPSFDRDIRDVIRIDPRVTINLNDGEGAVSCIGGNNRFNSFTIDGVQSNDAFGLNPSGLPARANFPIPFDSVRETAVEFSPYDVEYGQFTGCNINVVTKSGGNAFQGAAFAVFNSRSLTGSTIEGDTVLNDTPFKDYNWGASIGGPIIKDKLFFFVAYEEIDDAGELVDFGPSDAPVANPVDGFTQADVDRVEQIVNNTYGFPTGGLPSSLSETSRRILTRWDWLITDDHRLEFTYSREREARQDNDDAPGFNDLAFLNNFQVQGSKNERYSARLFSQWTDNFSTELRASRTDNEDLQDPLLGGEAQDADPIPRFIIFGNGGDDIISGPGFSRTANALVTQTDQIKAKFDYALGAHTLTGGYELNQVSVFNLFVQQATGTFEFASIDDFEAGLASEIFANGSVTGDINDAAASFARSIHSIYLQDEWQVTDALSAVLGVRYDFYKSGDVPPASQQFFDRYGFSNAVGYAGLDVIQPRFALNYDAGETLFGSTKFRAGAGVFSGGDPTVWFSNAYTNFGGIIVGAGAPGSGCGAGDLQVLSGGNFTGIPQCILDAQQAVTSLGNGRIDAIDPDFKIPSIIRGSIGFTHFTDFAGEGFFDDWRFDMDVIYASRRNAADFIDLTLTPTGQILPDGRPRFNAIDPLRAGCDAVFLGPRLGFSGSDLSDSSPCNAPNNRTQDILLTNVDGKNGHQLSISALLAKRFDFVAPGSRDGSFRVNMGYAYTQSKDVNPTTSSTATSNFEEVAVAILNNPLVSNTQFVNRHNLTIATTLEQEFIRDLSTSFTFFFQAREGRPFSYSFADNLTGGLGDPSFNTFGDTDDEERLLFYVPQGGALTVGAEVGASGFFATNDPRILVDSTFDVAAYNAFILENGLAEFGGQITPRNAFRAPWTYDLDFRFQQELPSPIEQLRTLFYVDVENVLNLIDDGLGVSRFADTGAVFEAVPVLGGVLDTVAGVPGADGSQYVYTQFQLEDGPFDRSSQATLWAVQFGLRFEF